MDTETVSTSRALFLPQTISYWMHSLQFTYKIKKQCWPHMGPFCWKRNNLFLKFSIKIHICIIIQFKAIREEWERSKGSCSISPPFVFLNEAEESLLELAFIWEQSQWGYSSSFYTMLLSWREEVEYMWNEKRHCRFPCLTKNSFKENNYFFKKTTPHNTSFSPFQKHLFLYNTLFL